MSKRKQKTPVVNETTAKLEYEKFPKPTTADYVATIEGLRELANAVETYGSDAEAVRIMAIQLFSRCNNEGQWGPLFRVWQWHYANERRSVFFLKLREIYKAVLPFAARLAMRPCPPPPASTLSEMADDIERQLGLKPATESDPDRERKQRGLDYWNSSDVITWADVAELLDNDRQNFKAVGEEIKRFAKANKQQIRPGKPGSPRLSQSKPHK